MGNQNRTDDGGACRWPTADKRAEFQALKGSEQGRARQSELEDTARLQREERQQYPHSEASGTLGPVFGLTCV